MENNKTTVQQESVVAIEAEARGLLMAYGKEVNLSFELKPDWNLYHTLEEAGALVVMAARNEGTLVGFAAFTMYPDINSRGEIAAHCNSLYLHPNFRKDGAGRKLIQYGDTLCRAKGVSRVMISSQTYQPIDGLLEAMGYEKAETIFIRRT